MEEWKEWEPLVHVGMLWRVQSARACAEGRPRLVDGAVSRSVPTNRGAAGGWGLAATGGRGVCARVSSPRSCARGSSRWCHGVRADPPFSAAPRHLRARCPEVSRAAHAAAARVPPQASRAPFPQDLGRQPSWRRSPGATMDSPGSYWLPGVRGGGGRGGRESENFGRSSRASWGSVCNGEADRRGTGPTEVSVLAGTTCETKQGAGRTTEPGAGAGGGCPVR